MIEYKMSEAAKFVLSRPYPERVRGEYDRLSDDCSGGAIV